MASELLCCPGGTRRLVEKGPAPVLVPLASADWIVRGRTGHTG